MEKKQQYVQITLDGYLKESQGLMLKRGYGDRKPVIVGPKGNIRDQVIPFVAESEGKRVSSKDLKKFIAGLNETSKNPSAAANMWLKRNKKFFITETKNGETFYSLSKIGKRLLRKYVPISESEISEKKDYDFVDKKKGKKRPGIYSSNESEEEDVEECEESVNEKQKVSGAGQDVEDSFLKGKKKKMISGKWANLLEKEILEEVGAKLNVSSEDLLNAFNEVTSEKIEESADDKLVKRRKKIKELLEEIREKKDQKVNEEEETEELNEEEDELSFDDLDLGDEEEEEEEKAPEEGEEAPEEKDEEVEEVEIAEFILTVDDAEAAIAELEERGITAEKIEEEPEEEIEEEPEPELDLGDEEEAEVEEAPEEEEAELDLEEASEEEEEIEEAPEEEEEEEVEEEPELDLGDEEEAEAEVEEAPEEEQVRVSAEHAEELVKWLEEKGVDVEEMFGGELEIEGGEKEEEIEEEPEVEEAPEEEAEEETEEEEVVEESLNEKKEDKKGFQAEIAKLRKKYPDFDEELGERKGHNKHEAKYKALLKKYNIKESKEEDPEKK